MAFKDYSTTPASNTTLGDGSYIGPNMLRNKVRPALQQIAADGKALADEVEARVNLAKGDPGGSPEAIGLFTTAAIHLGGLGFNIPVGIDVIATAGYNALDKGAALYVYDATVNSAYVTANPRSSFLSSNGRGFRLSKAQDITPEMFGAVGDGTADDAVAIQKAVDFLGAAGGGDVKMDALIYKTTVTVDNKYPRVRLVGTGAETVHDSGTPSGRTQILAPFAGTSLKIRSPYAAELGVTAANALKNVGAGCTGIMFNGGGVGTKAVEVDSVSNVDVDVYATGYVGTDVYEVKCGVTGTDLGESCDVQYSRLIFRARQITTAGEKASNILRLSGSSNANVSANRGPHHGIFVYAQHWDGACLVGISADNNDIGVNGYRAGGAGKLIDGKGKTASLSIGFDNNRIVFASGQGAITQEGTDTSGVTVGSVNIISARDITNGTPAPTAGTGSRWVDIGSDGVTTGALHAKLALGDTAANALLAIANLGNESLRVRNGSQNHVVLSDGTNTWGLNLDSSGNLRAVRTAGTGLFNLGASVTIPASGLINAANDAAAATAGVAVNQLYRNGSVLQVRVA